VHPVAERHQRIQALLKFSRSVMQRTQLTMPERDEMIENYCRLHWGLGQTAIADYKKTVIVTIQNEVEEVINRQLEKLEIAIPQS